MLNAKSQQIMKNICSGSFNQGSSFLLLNKDHKQIAKNITESHERLVLLDFYRNERVRTWGYFPPLPGLPGHFLPLPDLFYL